MPDFRGVITKRCPVSFDWEDETIDLVYRPYSEKIESEAKGEAKDWGGDAMKRLLVAILLDWNLTTDGKPEPITIEALTELPSELVYAMFYVVQEDIRSPKLPSTTSRSVSRQTATGA